MHGREHYCILAPMKLNRVASLALLLAFDAAAGDVEIPRPERQVELIRLVRQDCGSCHGLTFKGGLGTPLLAESLREKPASSLVATIIYGRPGTAMPPWKSILSEKEAEWIVDRLMAGFPHE